MTTRHDAADATLIMVTIMMALAHIMLVLSIATTIWKALR